MSNKNAQTPSVTKKVFAVYNYQTEHIDELLAKAIANFNTARGYTAIDYASEQVDDVETLIGRPIGDGTSIVLNLISYFAESYDYEAEERLSFMQNIVALESLLSISEGYEKPLLINISENNAFYQALNNRIQADRIELYMQHKSEQLSTLKAQDSVKWVNLELGYVTTPTYVAVFDQFGREFFVNSSVKVNPIPMKTMVDTLVKFIMSASSDHQYNDTVRLSGLTDQSMFDYLSEKAKSAKFHRYVDFVDALPYHEKYMRRYKTAKHISEVI